jgi:hypothetical protein
MSSSPLSSDLRFAAARASTFASRFVGSLIEAWRDAHPQQPLPNFLSAQDDAAVRLALCLRPREAEWTRDIYEIGTAIGLDTAQLDEFLRECSRIERLALAHPVTAEADGRLMAARDRDEEE